MFHIQTILSVITHQVKDAFGEYLEPLPSAMLPITIRVNTLQEDDDKSLFVEPIRDPDPVVFTHTNSPYEYLKLYDEDYFCEDSISYHDKHYLGLFFEKIMSLNPSPNQVIYLEFILGKRDNGLGMFELLKKMCYFQSRLWHLFQFRFHLFIYHDFSIDNQIQFRLPIHILKKFQWYSFVFETDPIIPPQNMEMALYNLSNLPTIPLGWWLADSFCVLEYIHLGEKILHISDIDQGLSFVHKFKNPEYEKLRHLHTSDPIWTEHYYYHD
ncbi:hypothetical protein DFJ63DRAFT_170300 [Scheffersomyces coipomensis]|uniref:uncharacterized protein n=1 Tax=Scheffersomyces coipomensis TaxID=1788519 RepID=UPI00315CDE24